MKIILISIIIGFNIGYLSGALIPKQLAIYKAKFRIGDCLSNGLFYERITDIRYSVVLDKTNYELSPTIDGKIGAPSTTAVWIVDDTYVKINPVNCK